MSRNRDKGERVSALEDVPVPLEVETVSPRPPVTEYPSDAVELTVDRAFFASRTDPVVEAFVAVEKLRPDGVRKLTKQGWLSALAEFKAAPRP